MFTKFAAAVSAIIILSFGFSFFPHVEAVDDNAIQVVRFSENFDGVTAPAIPNGWSVSPIVLGAGFATVTNNPDTAPNTIFAPSPNFTSISSLTSPPMLVTGGTTVLNFRHRYGMETTWDGGVLEISIGGGSFQDIIDAGGTFLAGPYTHDLNVSTNPLGGRRAWSGATQVGYITTSVRLPANAFGQTVQFRWQLGTNDNFPADGWWIDTVTLETIPTASNTNSITISNVGPANPYPSQIQVNGLSGFVTGLTVSLENFSHTAPDDVDILLVAPNGRRIVLMSDTGGANAVSDVDLTFTDSATVSLTDNSSISSGVFKPTDFEGGDVFPAPAPQGSVSGSTLSSFYGVNPNGAWQLFIIDDNANNSGAVTTGWSLDIQSSINACLFNLSPTAQGFTSAGGNGTFQINIPTGCGWTASTSSNFLSFTSATSGESTGAINFTVAPNTGAARTGLISVTDGVTTRTFQAQQGSGCPTSIAQTNLNVSAAGGNSNVAVTAGAGCTWQAVSNVGWIQITSEQQTGNGTASLTVASNPTRQARSANVTVGALNLTVNQAGASATPFDFDGDGRAEIGVFRNGTWFLDQSTGNQAVFQFGLTGDKIVPADYDGDGKADPAVFRNGIWYILQSSNSQALTVQFGITGDLPQPADVTGDGRAELVIFRNGTWFTLDLVDSQTIVTQFGLAGDKPVIGDYDGDGRAEPAVFRNGTWFLLRSTLGFTAVQFGTATDRPVIGDYDGDGKTDLAVYRNGQWHLLTNLQNYSVTQFGLATDVPVPADYDNDDKTDFAVYRNGTWFLLRSTEGYGDTVWGLAADQPVPSAFLP